jgi:UDP-glucose 4-epimerase
MDTPTLSISCASTPASSVRSLDSNISTPLTERSLLFDDVPSIPLEGDFDHKRYILVVGGLGYIGSHTTWELLKAGRNVIIIDNLSNSFRQVLDRLHSLRDGHFRFQKNQPSIQFHEADYRDRPTVKAILRKYAVSSTTSFDSDAPEVGAPRTPKSSITGVIHFAAYKAVAESIQQPLKYYANNVGGMVDFCSLLGEFGIKTFVFSSSATVYGELANRGGRLPEELCTHTTTRWIDSDDNEVVTCSGSTGLTSPYGRSKWMCEAILSDLAISDPEWTIIALRYFNPIGCDPSGMLGEDPRGTPNNLMPAVVKAMTGELPVMKIYGTDWETKDGTAIRDFIHVSDLAQGHIVALFGTENLICKGGFHVFNLGTGSGHSVREVVDTMEAVSGRSIATQEVDRRDGDVAMCIAEPTKVFTQLGWTTRKSLRQSCEDICRFLGIKDAKQ